MRNPYSEGFICPNFYKTMTNAFEDPRIEDYVFNRLNAIEKADFEADMMMDEELEIAVAYRFMMKIKNDKRVQDELERELIPEVIEFKHETFVPQQNEGFKKARKKWGNLLSFISSN